MKAFYATAYGGSEVMRLGDLADVVPRASEVVVTVKASSINPLDWKIREGYFKIITGHFFPKVLGLDFAGVVKAKGAKVPADLTIGQPVYGYTPIWRSPGAHVEQVAVEAKRLRPLPKGLSFELAASLPGAALTALNGLRLCGELSGKTVVVNGATGGVGHFALQIAKAKGATVTAVCSGKNRLRAEELGADRVIDYLDQDFTRADATYDVIYDAFGKLSFDAAVRVLSAHGYYVTTTGTPRLTLSAVWRKLTGGGRRVKLASLRDRQEDNAELESLLKSGAVNPVVEKVFPFEQIEKAFATLEAGGIVGKVVIRIGENDFVDPFRG